VVGVQGAGPGGGVLVLREQTFQLLILFGPTALVRVEGICQPTPADVLGQDFLCLRRGAASLCLDGLQGADGLDVAGKLLLGAALTRMLVGNAEVSGRWYRNFRLLRLNMEPFDLHIV